MTQNRYDYLDNLRFIAIFGVMIHHYYSPWMPGGFLGVYVFFAISGFLIAGSLQHLKTPSFYIRRAFRIFLPLFAIANVYYLTLADNVDYFTVLKSLLLIEYNPKIGYAYAVLWSLLAEVGFYLIAPFLIWGVNLWKVSENYRLAIVAIPILLSWYLFFNTDFRSMIPQWFKFTYSYFDCFLFGVFACYFVGEKGVKAGKAISYSIVAIAIISIALLYFLPIKGSAFDHQIRSFSALLTAIIIIFSHNNISWGYRVFSYLGKISFSMYLIHGIVLGHRIVLEVRNIIIDMGLYKALHLTSRYEIEFTYPFIFFATCVVLSALSYLIFELPAMKAGHWLSKLNYTKPNLLNLPKSSQSQMQ